MRIYVLQRLPSNLLQELGRRKHGTGVEPTRDMIATDVIEQRLLRNGKDYILQLFQIAHTRHLFKCIRIAEYKISKTKMLGNDFTQVYIHFFRVLIHKTRVVSAGVYLIIDFC